MNNNASIPQRKSSLHPLGQAKGEFQGAGKAYFSNTNVMTGIAQHAEPTRQKTAKGTKASASPCPDSAQQRRNSTE